MIDNRDFMYTLGRVNDKTSVWRCRSRYRTGCKARATTVDNEIIKFTSDHNHSPLDQAGKDTLK